MQIISRQEAKELGLKLYFTGKPCTHGHISDRYVSNSLCKECQINRAIDFDRANPEAAKLRKKVARLKNKDRYNEVARAIRSRNRDKVREQGRNQDRKRRSDPEFRAKKAAIERERYRNNPEVRDKAKERSKSEAARAAQKLSRQTERGKMLSRVYEERRNSCPIKSAARKLRNKIYKSSAEAKRKHAEVERTRRASMKDNPVYALDRRVRSLISCSFRRRGFTKRSKTYEILGCSWEEFTLHIERQFLKGMNWENRSEWHIDHIIPISTATTEDDVIALNHVSNLRPIWATDNLSKSDKILFLI